MRCGDDFSRCQPSCEKERGPCAERINSNRVVVACRSPVECRPLTAVLVPFVDMPRTFGEIRRIPGPVREQAFENAILKEVSSGNF